MLQALFGNENIQKILLFLFVNQKCYGAQMQRLLKTPLTSLQNGLSRLEKGGIILSYYEGKTKIFQLNRSYPLIIELEQLLKKAFTLLPPQEKKKYAQLQYDHIPKKTQEPSLLHFWERLQNVQQFTRHTKSASQQGNGWDGKGQGEVLINRVDEKTLVFHERGFWQMKQGQDISFSNVFRWTLDREAGMISLEHLRHGSDQPVFLFHLAPAGNQLLASVESHLCEEDAYLATVPWDQYGIRLNWRVIGPKKNEEMEYCYS